MNVAVDLPAPLGGVVPDGTYVLTQRNYYWGPGGPSGPTNDFTRQTMVLAGGAYATVIGAQGDPPIVAGGDYQTAGTDWMFNGSCPRAFVAPYAYTVAGDELHLYDFANDVESVYSILP